MQKASELARRGEAKRQAGDFVSRQQERIGWRIRGFVAMTLDFGWTKQPINNGMFESYQLVQDVLSIKWMDDEKMKKHTC